MATENAESLLDVVAVIPVGKSPTSIAFTPDSAWAYVTNGGRQHEGGGTLSPIDTKAGMTIGLVDLHLHRELPQGAAVSPDGKLAFCGISDPPSIAKIDISEPHPTSYWEPLAYIEPPKGCTPIDLLVSDDCQFLYVLCQSTSRGYGGLVAKIEIASGILSSKVQVGDSPASLALSHDGKRLYVSHFSANVWVIDTADFTVDGDPIHSSGSNGLAMSHDDSLLYVANLRPDLCVVSVIDTAKRELSGEPIKLPEVPWALALSPQDRFLYVTLRGSNQVSVVDTRKRASIGSPVAVGKAPWAIAASPDGGLVYVANRDTNNVSVLQALAE